MTKIYLYDTTLRDGTQREGIPIPWTTKSKSPTSWTNLALITSKAAGPALIPKTSNSSAKPPTLELKHAKIAAFGSTRRKNADVATDPNIKALLDANTPVVTLVGKSWDLHVTDVLETTHGRKPGDDRRERGLLPPAGQRSHLRRRTLFRWLQSQRRVCRGDGENGRYQRRPQRGLVRHQRRLPALGVEEIVRT
jgi:hypothetical protein